MMKRVSSGMVVLERCLLTYVLLVKRSLFHTQSVSVAL